MSNGGVLSPSNLLLVSSRSRREVWRNCRGAAPRTWVGKWIGGDARGISGGCGMHCSDLPSRETRKEGVKKS